MEINGMHEVFGVGDTIYGYCNGYFGRDDYEDKVCVLVNPRYAVFEYESGTATVVNFTERFKEVYLEDAFKWKTEIKD